MGSEEMHRDRIGYDRIGGTQRDIKDAFDSSQAGTAVKRDSHT